MVQQRQIKQLIDTVLGGANEAREWVQSRYISIATKLALVFTLLIAAGMLSLGAVITHNQNLLLEEQLTDFGRTIAKQVAESSKEHLLADDTLGLEVVTANAVEHERILGAAILNDELAVQTRAGRVPEEMGEPPTAERARLMRWQAADTERELYSFLTPVLFRDVVVGYGLVTLDSTLADRAQAETMRTVVGATFLLVILGVFASVFLGRRLTRPIYDLMHASRAISRGEYDIRFDERRNDELGALMESMNTMSAGLLRKEQVEKTFSRYVSPNVAKEVLSDLERIELGGRHVNASVLFADIVGFTSMSERMEPEAVSHLLNEYFSLIADAAHACNGHVDKYIGDCAMLVFGVPTPNPEHPFDAITCAVLIQELVARINARRAENGDPPVHFRVGVNSGTMLAGNMGSSDRLEYTVVGDAVNLASRLGHAGNPGQVIISEEMHADSRVAGRVVSEQQGEIRLRGKSEPVAIYTVTDVAPEYRGALDKRLTAIFEES